MSTYYQILSITETASQQEIKSAFRRLSLRYHPDRNNGDKNAEAKFREVLEAYKVLSDPDKKSWYDRRLFYQRQPPPPQSQPQPQPQPQPHWQPQSKPRSEYLYRSMREAMREYYGEAQPDFSRMPWKFMGIFTAGFILFFVLLYNFGPQPKSPYDEEQEKTIVELTPVAVIEITERKLKLQNGSFSSVKEIVAKHPGANIVELYPDIDDDGVRDLQLSVTYPEQGAFSSHDYIFRSPAQKGSNDEFNDENVIYEEFFTHEGGTYIVGNNLRLYFDKVVETYHSCILCRVDGLPNNLVPAIYLRAEKGHLLFAGTNERRNHEIEENLAFLQSRGIPDLENYNDDGTRKEYIRQIVAYYFNNRNSSVTEALFRKYYSGADANLVWKDAVTIIETYAQKITSNAAFSNTEVL